MTSNEEFFGTILWGYRTGKGGPVSVFKQLWDNALQGKPPCPDRDIEDYWQILYMLAPHRKLIDDTLAGEASFDKLIEICEKLIEKVPLETPAGKNILRKKIRTSCFNRTILVEVLQRMGLECVIKGEDIHLSCIYFPYGQTPKGENWVRAKEYSLHEPLPDRFEVFIGTLRSLIKDDDIHVSSNTTHDPPKTRVELLVLMIDKICQYRFSFQNGAYSFQYNKLRDPPWFFGDPLRERDAREFAATVENNFYNLCVFLPEWARQLVSRIKEAAGELVETSRKISPEILDRVQKNISDDSTGLDSFFTSRDTAAASYMEELKKELTDIGKTDIKDYTAPEGTKYQEETADLVDIIKGLEKKAEVLWENLVSEIERENNAAPVGDTLPIDGASPGENPPSGSSLAGFLELRQKTGASGGQQAKKLKRPKTCRYDFILMPGGSGVISQLSNLNSNYPHFPFKEEEEILPEHWCMPITVCPFYMKTQFAGGMYHLDAIEYCNRLSLEEGLTPSYHKTDEDRIIWNKEADGYRMPTLAELAWFFGTFNEGPPLGYILPTRPSAAGGRFSPELCWGRIVVDNDETRIKCDNRQTAREIEAEPDSAKFGDFMNDNDIVYNVFSYAGKKIEASWALDSYGRLRVCRSVM